MKETKKLKEQLLLLEQGKVFKVKKEKEKDDEILQLKFKLENLMKIRKAKLSKYKNDLKEIFKVSYCFIICRIELQIIVQKYCCV